MSATIEAFALDKFFGSTVVMRGVRLQVEPCTGLVVQGRNGAGKSTLIRLLAGIDAPSGGAARLFGSPSRQLTSAQRRRVGLLSHQSFLYANLTARENLEFFCRLYLIESPSTVAESWLARVGLARAANERVRRFSRGMEQRLSLARAMLARPDALLMDEPFAGLDADGVELVAELLREALARGCAILMTAHQRTSLRGLDLAHWELRGGRLEERCARS